MDLDTLKALFDIETSKLPEGVGAEMRADLNHLTQELKNNKCKTAEELKLKADYLTNEFKLKHGSNSSK